MQFEDFEEITRRRYEYALGIDTRDYALLRSVFTEKIVMDFQDYNGAPAATLNSDDWVAGCKVLFDGLDSTQHVMTNPLVEVAGEKARCRMYMKAEHFLKNDQGGSEYSIGGYYTDELVKTQHGWRISKVTLKLFWQRGNRHIMQLAVERHPS